jgi:hypothetical protein
MVHQVEMLENTINTRREFLAYIFHEIRVPFQVVKLGVNELVTSLPNPVFAGNFCLPLTMMPFLGNEHDGPRQQINSAGSGGDGRSSSFPFV